MTRGEVWDTGVHAVNFKDHDTIRLRLDTTGSEVGIWVPKHHAAIYVRRSDFSKLVKILTRFMERLNAERV